MVAAPAPGDDRPGAGEVDQALLGAWQRADNGAVLDAARQARLAVTAALVAGAPALSDRQRAMLDMLEGTLLLMHAEHAAGLARLGRALAWFSPPETLAAGAAAGSRWLPPVASRTTPPWACSALGLALGALGDAARGLAWVACAAEGAARQGLARVSLQAQSDQGHLLSLLDQHLPAIQALQKAVSLASKSAPRQTQAELLNQLAATWLAWAHDRQARRLHDAEQGAARHALACANRALDAAQTGSVSQARPQALCHRAEAWLLLGHTDKAAADLLAIGTDPGLLAATRIECGRVQALAQWHQHQAEAARSLIDQALAQSRADADLPARGRLLALRLALEYRDGTPASAAWWRLQRQAHDELLFKRRLAAAELSSRLLGALDLATSGLPHDPAVQRPDRPGPGADGPSSA